MIHYSGQSFWGDEMGTIMISGMNQTLLETLKANIKVETQGGLLFYPLAHIWMKLVPYGTKWLLLLNELIVCGGIILLGQAAKKIHGNIAGIMSVFIACVTSYLTLQGAYEFRCYGVNFFCSVLTLWTYLQKQEKPTWLRLVFYGFSGTLLTYSHFTSVFFFFVLFLADFFCFVKKQITIRHILSYLVWGFLFLPYLIYAYVRVTEKLPVFWTSAPKITEIFTLGEKMMQNPLLCTIYYAGVVWLFFLFVNDIVKKHNVVKSPYNRAYLILWTIIGFILINFTYSALNPNHSMWNLRYCFSIMGSMIIVCGIFMSDLTTRLFTCKLQPVWKVVFSFILVCAAGWLEMRYAGDLKYNLYPDVISEPYEQTAEFLRGQDDFWAEDTAFYSSAFIIEAWQYYLAHGDMTPGLLTFLPLNLTSCDLSKYRVIYVVEIQNPISEETWEYLALTHDREEIHHDYRIYRYTRR